MVVLGAVCRSVREAGSQEQDSLRPRAACQPRGALPGARRAGRVRPGQLCLRPEPCGPSTLRGATPGGSAGQGGLCPAGLRAPTLTEPSAQTYLRLLEAAGRGERRLLSASFPLGLGSRSWDPLSWVSSAPRLQVSAINPLPAGRGLSACRRCAHSAHGATCRRATHPGPRSPRTADMKHLGPAVPGLQAPTPPPAPQAEAAPDRSRRSGG